MRVVPLFLSLLLILGCSSPKKLALTPEQLELAQMAYDLATKSEALVEKAPSTLSALNNFDEQAQRFNNASQRFGAGSLEARDEFNKLRYQAAQLDRVLTKESYPDLLERWKEIRNDMDKIASRLGYKIESQ